MITALKYEKIPQTVRKVYSELLLQPENIKQLHGLLSSDSQKKLVERNVLFNEDIDNISSEREKTESDTAAVLVLLDRLWRKNTKWIEELSNIFKSKDVVFSQKLFLYSTGIKITFLIIYVKSINSSSACMITVESYFIRGRQCSWVAKIVLVRGDVISLVV